MLIYGRTAASESKECGNVGAGAGRHVCDGEDGRVGINCEEASVARRDLASLERSSVANADLANLQHSLASFVLYSSFASRQPRLLPVLPGSNAAVADTLFGLTPVLNDPEHANLRRPRMLAAVRQK